MAAKKDPMVECKCPKSCSICDEKGHCPDHCISKPPKSFWVLFDSKNIFCGAYLTEDEAVADAYGPRFRKGFDVLEYKKVKK